MNERDGNIAIEIAFFFRLACINKKEKQTYDYKHYRYKNAAFGELHFGGVRECK